MYLVVAAWLAAALSGCASGASYSGSVTSISHAFNGVMVHWQINNLTTSTLHLRCIIQVSSTKPDSARRVVYPDVTLAPMEHTEDSDVIVTQDREDLTGKVVCSPTVE
jgi:hypothetical protein